MGLVIRRQGAAAGLGAVVSGIALPVVRSIGRGALSLVLPPACPVCRRAVEGMPLPCPACDGALRLLWDEARRCDPIDLISPFPYAGAVRTLVRRMKYQGDRASATYLGEMMAARLVSSGIDPRAGVLVPVPLHSTRLRERGFNQAERLAQTVGRMTGLSVRAGLLRRVRWTVSQTTLDPDERREAVRGAFRSCPAAAGPDRPILVDDVWTTGATAEACREVLLAAGVPAPIPVLTAAHAVLARDPALED